MIVNETQQWDPPTTGWDVLDSDGETGRLFYKGGPAEIVLIRRVGKGEHEVIAIGFRSLTNARRAGAMIREALALQDKRPENCEHKCVEEMRFRRKLAAVICADCLAVLSEEKAAA